MVPVPQQPEVEDKEVTAQAQEAAAEFLRLFPELEFPKALARVWEFVGHLNRYIVATAPWELAKDTAAQPRLDTVLYYLLESLRWLASLLNPVIPASARKMADQLGPGASLWEKPLPEMLRWGGLAPGTTLHKGEALFPRLE